MIFYTDTYTVCVGSAPNKISAFIAAAHAPALPACFFVPIYFAIACADRTAEGASLSIKCKMLIIREWAYLIKIVSIRSPIAEETILQNLIRANKRMCCLSVVLHCHVYMLPNYPAVITGYSGKKKIKN